MTCTLGYDGYYYARELVQEQTLENLQAFSDKLVRAYEHMKARKLS